MIITYKYYDERKRRLAIAAYLDESDMIQIHIITCSRKDSFNKKEARAALESLAKREIPVIHEKKIIRTPGEKNRVELVELPLHPRDLIIDSYFPSWQESFFTWADGNFWKIKTVTIPQTVIAMVRGKYALNFLKPYESR